MLERPWTDKKGFDGVPKGGGLSSTDAASAITGQKAALMPLAGWSAVFMYFGPILKDLHEIRDYRTSPVVQWLRFRLPMQGTWVQALVREDPTCRGATKPMRHNY
ncbi:hypothetical protein J1605_011149 [Eschrichtius robustus]|uniref:Uncharacterized protein n=1 Tax=Eschrichtius robustus TaxID=9764 RepID=A0AB34GRA4_ESCRO|nr:hypothetical protein J1605_011149 [Eschrichtius robustus]